MTAFEDFKESVSRETLELLNAFSELLLKWNQKINLVAPGEESRLWERHILDSAQLYQHAPKSSGNWFDFGSGGGFPGIVCAILSMRDEAGTKFHFVESDQRKSIFLTQVARELSLPLTVHNRRIEQFSGEPADVISARALAPLAKLLELSAPHLHPDSILLFPKGKRVESELTQASQSWNMNIHRIRSLTDPDGVILKLTGVHSRL